LQEPVFAPVNKKELTTMETFLETLIKAEKYISECMRNDVKMVLGLLRADSTPICEAKAALAALDHLIKNKAEILALDLVKYFFWLF
jgi:hypothetical protein